jgi:hypothetical protein
VTAQPPLIAAWVVGFMRNRELRKEQAIRTAVYQRITDQIVSELEKGVRPWMKPWNAEHAAGRITRPLRGNGIPYQGINVLMLRSAVLLGVAFPVLFGTGPTKGKSPASKSSGPVCPYRWALMGGGA